MIWDCTVGHSSRSFACSKFTKDVRIKTTNDNHRIIAAH